MSFVQEIISYSRQILACLLSSELFCVMKVLNCSLVFFLKGAKRNRLKRITWLQNIRRRNNQSLQSGSKLQHYYKLGIKAAAGFICVFFGGGDVCLETFGNLSLAKSLRMLLFLSFSLSIPEIPGVRGISSLSVWWRKQRLLWHSNNLLEIQGSEEEISGRLGQPETLRRIVMA